MERLWLCAMCKMPQSGQPSDTGLCQPCIDEPLDPMAVSDAEIHAQFIDLRNEARQRMANGQTKEHVAAWLLEISGQPIVGLEHEAAVTQARYQLAASKAWRELMGLRTLREDAEGY